MNSTLLGPDGKPISSGVYKAANLDPMFFFGNINSNNMTEEEITAKPYQNHVWTYACARAISWNVSRLRHRLILSDTKEEIEKHPLLDLFSNPNTLLSESSFWQYVILLLLMPTKGTNNSSLGGQVFIVPWSSRNDQPVNLQKGEIPDELFPFSDSFFEPILKQNHRGMKSVTGWKFKISGSGKGIEFESNQLIRIQLMNPYDVLRGMSPGYASQIAVSQDAKSDIYNSNLFDNDGRVSGVLSTDQYVTQDQADEYMTRWRSRYGGPGNAGKIALLGNGLKYQQLGLTKSEMQYIEQKDTAREQVLAAFGLNKIAVGLYEQINHATIIEGRKMLWQDTYLPIDKIIWSALNTQWIKYVDRGNLKGCSDISDIVPLQPDHDKQATAMGKYVQQCDLPPVIAARLVGVELTEEELQNYPYLSEPPRKNIGASPEPEKDNKAISDNKKFIELDIDLQNDKLDMFWLKYIEKVADPGEKNFKRKLIRFFISQRNRLQDIVDDWAKSKKSIISIKEISVNPKLFVLNSKEELERLLTIYGPSVLEQLKIEEQALIDELGELIAWGVKDPMIDAFVKTRTEYLKTINNTTFKRVEDKVIEAIQEGMDENVTVPEMAKKIKSAIYDTFTIRQHHANMVARTEMNTISSMARFDAFKEEGIDKHRWVTAMDERVRTGIHSHRKLNNEIVPVGKIFKRDGISTKMVYPRDSKGELGDIINCRCVAVAEIED